MGNCSLCLALGTHVCCVCGSVVPGMLAQRSTRGRVFLMLLPLPPPYYYDDDDGDGDGNDYYENDTNNCY